MPQPLFQLHATGPVGLILPECAVTSPEISGKALLASGIASLLLQPSRIGVGFWGWTGSDEIASILRRALMPLAVDRTYFRRYPGNSPEPGSKIEASLIASQFFSERVENPKTWPEEPFYQSTWILIELPLVEAHAAELNHARVSEWLHKGRRRGCLNALWVTAEQFANLLLPVGNPIPWHTLDLLIVDGESLDLASSWEVKWNQALSWGVNSILLFDSMTVFVRSQGGVFGQVDARWDLPSTQSIGRPLTVTTLVGAFFAHLFRELMGEDQFNLTEVHLDKELLQERPLHLGRAIDWALTALELTPRFEASIPQEPVNGEWLSATESAWKKKHPEAFILW